MWTLYPSVAWPSDRINAEISDIWLPAILDLGNYLSVCPDERVRPDERRPSVWTLFRPDKRWNVGIIDR